MLNTWTVIMACILHLIHYIKNIEDINQLIAKKHTKMRHITLDTYDWMYLLDTGKAYVLNGNFNIGEHINAKCFHTSMPNHIREMIVVNKIPLISMNDINLNDINSDKKYIFELETKK